MPCAGTGSSGGRLDRQVILDHGDDRGPHLADAGSGALPPYGIIAVNCKDHLGVAPVCSG
jgi:hypothetical protein